MALSAPTNFFLSEATDTQKVAMQANILPDPGNIQRWEVLDIDASVVWTTATATNSISYGSLDFGGGHPVATQGPFTARYVQSASATVSGTSPQTGAFQVKQTDTIAPIRGAVTSWVQD